MPRGGAVPKTEIVFFQNRDGSSPLVEWLITLPRATREKLLGRIELLAKLGHELRRPYADFLRDGVFELRARCGHVNYRILYFFHDRTIVLSHGFTKERAVPEREIVSAMRRRNEFSQAPDAHTLQRQARSFPIETDER
jgi:hypothetical protein